MSGRSYRREFLGTSGAVLTVGIAGCAGSTGSGEESADSTGSGEESRELDLEVSVGDIDLTELNASQMEDYPAAQIRQEFSADVTVTVLEDGDETEIGRSDLETFYFEVRNKPEFEDREAWKDHIEEIVEEDGTEYARITGLESVPEFLVRDDETVHFGGEIDGQEIHAEAQVNKILPDLESTGYILDGRLQKDGQTIFQTNYTDNFLFNTQHTDFEEYRQKRIQETQERTQQSTYRKATENIQKEAFEDTLEEYEGREQKRRLLAGTNAAVNRTIGSLNASRQAALEDILLRNMRQNEDGEIYFVETHTEDQDNQIFDEVYGSHLRNPAPGGGTNPSKIHYIDGDLYHHETNRIDARHVEDMGEAEIIDGVNQDYKSVIAELEEGNMDEIRFEHKMGEMTAAYAANLSLGISTNDITVTDEYGSNGLEMKRENTERNKVYSPLILGAEHHWETDNMIIAAGEPENSEIIVTNNEDIHRQIDTDVGFQSSERIKREVLR